MPLLAGTTTVTLGVASGVGLSKELFDAMRVDQGIAQIPINDAALKMLAKTCNTIASVVISHFKTNGVITTSDTGTVAPGIPVTTAGTAAAQTGATTATGVVTASGTGTIA